MADLPQTLKRLQAALRVAEPPRGSTLLANWYGAYAQQLAGGDFFDSLADDDALVDRIARANVNDPGLISPAAHESLVRNEARLIRQHFRSLARELRDLATPNTEAGQ